MNVRCSWVPLDNQEYIDYHDNEWGKPNHSDTIFFEFLVLEGAQAGLSWVTILKRREEYKKVFKKFNPLKISLMNDEELEGILQNSNIIKNRLKVYSVRQNAKIFIEIQKEFGSFDMYVWRFVNNKTITHRFSNLEESLTTIPESILLSKDLKKRGMNFVGEKIMYAFMQANGLVNDHMECCYLAE